MELNFILHSLNKNNLGGVNKITTNLANELVKRGFAVNIISLGKVDKPAYDLNSRIHIKDLGFLKDKTSHYKGFHKIFWFIKAFRSIHKEIKRSESNNKVFLFTSPPLLIVAGLLKFFHPNEIFLGQEHTSTTYTKGSLIDNLKYLIYKNIDLIIAITKNDADFYKNKGLNTTYIPNYIDIISSRIGQLNNRKYILFVGRLSSEKQPITALKVYLKSKLYEHNIHFRIFGRGEMLNEVRNFISNNDLTNYVEVLTEINDENSIYKDGYALIMTSRVEGFGLVLIEALARDIPCIAFNVPYGPRNVIIEGVNGYLIEPYNIDEFAAKLASKEFESLLDTNLHDTIRMYDKENIIKLWLQTLYDLKT